MFILDFFLGGLMDQLIDWIYSQLVGFFGNFFAAMGNMGVELFDMEWVQSIVLFFSGLGIVWRRSGCRCIRSGNRVSNRPSKCERRRPQCHQGIYGRGLFYTGASGAL